MISNFSEQNAWHTRRAAKIYNADTEGFSRKMPIHDLIRPSLGLARAVFTGQSQYAVGHLAMWSLTRFKSRTKSKCMELLSTLSERPRRRRAR